MLAQVKLVCAGLAVASSCAASTSTVDERAQPLEVPHSKLAAAAATQEAPRGTERPAIGAAKAQVRRQRRRESRGRHSHEGALERLVAVMSHRRRRARLLGAAPDCNEESRRVHVAVVQRLEQRMPRRVRLQRERTPQCAPLAPPAHQRDEVVVLARVHHRPPHRGHWRPHQELVGLVRQDQVAVAVEHVRRQRPRQARRGVPFRGTRAAVSVGAPRRGGGCHALLPNTHTLGPATTSATDVAGHGPFMLHLIRSPHSVFRDLDY